MNPPIDMSPTVPSPTDVKAEEDRPVANLVLPLNTPPIRIDTEVDAQGLAKLLAHTEQTWTRLGQLEPHWSVISAERFRQAELDANRAEFYASGQGDVETFLAFLARNDVDTAGFHKALEYGCGVGRVTRFLAQRFSKVVACDISPSHLAQADQYLKACAIDNVTCVRIRSLADIDGPADLDVVFCVIVLQHNPPPAIVAILHKLLARLRPGGVAYFQVPTHAVDYSFNVNDYMAHGLEAGHIEMHYVPQRRLFQIAQASDCDVLEVREDDWVGRRHVELSNTFLLRRR